MIVIPAIDLKGGRCVRLRQGRADDECVYSDSPADMARRWVDLGAPYLHVVDLDGAFSGRPVHLDAIAAIVRVAAGVGVEVGGGLRKDEDIRRLVGIGVDRAIIGTRAFAEPDGLRSLAGEFGTRLAVGIDARDGWVQVKGWVETTRTRGTDLAMAADSAGVRTIVYTDTATDGMLAGTNAAAIGEVCRAVGCSVIASGGISSAGDIQSLARLGCANLAGAIVGKALYEGSVSLRVLQDAASRA